MVHEFNRFGVLITDKQRARMFVFEMGELADHSELFDELPRDYDVRGEADKGDHHAHVDELTSQHLRRAAAVAFHVFNHKGFEHFTFACPDAVTGELEAALHPYLRERLVPRVNVAIGAGLDQIRDATLALEMDVDRAADAAAVDRLRGAVATGQRGAAGLADTLGALNQHRVAALLVSDGFTEPGWRCDGCQLMATIGRTCPACADEMSLVEDIVEEAIDEALRQSCAVRLCVGNADLDVLGRVGAILRY
jgi:peptide chain release factor subunit 1